MAGRAGAKRASNQRAPCAGIKQPLANLSLNGFDSSTAHNRKERKRETATKFGQKQQKRINDSLMGEKNSLPSQ